MKVNIQNATKEQEPTILEIHRQAFARDAEAALVALLIQSAKDRISLIAYQNETAVGHILFSPVTIEQENGSVDINLVGLAPVSVLPQFQGKGVGSQLIEAGIQRCGTDGYDGVVVLGSPTYYGRFGFVAATLFGFSNEYGVDAEFMAQELRPDAFMHMQGLIKYAPEFAETGS